jgi:UPF0755 protein
MPTDTVPYVTIGDMAGLPSAPPRARYKVELARQRRRNFATVVAIGAMLTPLLVGSLWVLANVETSTQGTADILLEVEQNWGPNEVAGALAKAHVVTTAEAFTTLATAQNVTTFKPGLYYLYADEGPEKALAILQGDPAEQIPDQKLLLPPGLTLDKIAARIGTLKNKSADRFLEVANQGTIRSKFEPDAVSSLEGLTWPDTYNIGATETETQILQKIVDQFDKRAAAAGLGGPEADPYDALRIASMVQTEAGTNDDMPLIAAVLWNRIHKNMPLQVDATLCYAKHGCPPLPTDADKKIDSPYNTYKVLGLPPTPIATVSQNAIQAALHPAAVDYLYYVSDKNGKTYYASTLAEQEKNIARARAAN